jgi:hypothetical protein
MRGFKEVGWVIAVAGTTLGCYMVNLQVASERAALEDVSNRVVLAQRDIRVLQTEIGTRGRLEQLESWNVKVLALSAPQAHQFLEGGYQLATLTAPQKTVDPAAPVVLAAAPAPQAATENNNSDNRPAGSSARDMMHVASLKRDLAPDTPKKAVDKGATSADRPVKAAPEAAKAKPIAEQKRKAATRTAGAAEAPPKPKPMAKPAKATSPTKSKDVQVR